MSRKRLLVALVPLLLLTGWVIVACGDDDATSPTSPAVTSGPVATSTTASADPTTTPVTTGSATTEPVTTSAPTTVAPTTTPAPDTTVPPALEQAAIWPAADIAFATPEQAASDFVAEVLGVPPELGPFMQGDNRSGEIEVFSPGEGGPGSRVVRSLLLLRQLGPDSGWFVTAALSDGVTIAAPAQGSTAPAGIVTVSGTGRGFEATLIVTAFVAGDPAPIVEPVIATGGALETPEPFTAQLDLTGVSAGTAVTVLVRGDTGLETDPGEFAAVAMNVG